MTGPKNTTGDRQLLSTQAEKLRRSETAAKVRHKKMLREDHSGMTTPTAHRNYINQLAGMFRQSGFNDKQLAAILTALQHQGDRTDAEINFRDFLTDREDREGQLATRSDGGKSTALARQELMTTLARAAERALYAGR
jgi:hypothetical protein